MDALRIVLVIIGIILVFGIYVFHSGSVLSDKNKQDFTGLLSKLTAAIKQFFRMLSDGLKGSKYFNVNSNLNSSSAEPYQQNSSILSDEQIHDMSNIVASRYSDNVTDSEVAINSAGRKGDKNNKPPVVDVSLQSSKQNGGKTLLITLTILPKPDEVFIGADIMNACKQAGMQLGEYNIFHRYSIIEDKVVMIPVCSLVNLFEPGYFDIQKMDDFTTAGLSLFMQLPGPVDSRKAFAILMDVSEKLSLNLNATICDETRSVLTAQTISHLKEKVENFRFKLKMESLKSH